jgi:hypothetical protein
VGQQLLLQDIRNGDIPSNMDWKVAFARRPEFAVGDTPSEAKRLFQNRLKNARKKIEQNNNRASSELSLLQADRVAVPPPATDHQGFPRWEGSAAQIYLKQDVAANHHVGINKIHFFLSRDEYQLFTADFIWQKVRQEEKRIKYLRQRRECRGFVPTPRP